MDNDRPIESEQWLGVVDIVEAFTALRHELKLQVRGGRELQQAVDERLQQFEIRLNEQSVILRRFEPAIASPPATMPVDGGARPLAEALAEIEENLQRIVETLKAPLAAGTGQPRSSAGPAHVIQQFDQTVAAAGPMRRLFARPLVAGLRRIIEDEIKKQAQADATIDPAKDRLDVSQRGLELLLERVRRLMQACGVQRHDVLGQAFDAETMRAIDVVSCASVPSSHVAEQIRPLYLWQGQVLRYADVRLAK